MVIGLPALVTRVKLPLRRTLVLHQAHSTFLILMQHFNLFN